MKTILSTIAIFAASSAFAADQEKVDLYVEKILEITDFKEAGEISAAATLDALAQSGLTFSGNNRDQAVGILTETFAEILPKAMTLMSTDMAEIYTDAEIDAILAFIETEAGASFMSKGALLGAKSSATMQNELMADIMPKMMEVIPLAD